MYKYIEYLYIRFIRRKKNLYILENLYIYILIKY